MVESRSLQQTGSVTDDQIVLVLAAYALRGELAKIVDGREKKQPYRFPDDVPAEQIEHLLDFLWNLMNEIRFVHGRLAPDNPE